MNSASVHGAATATATATATTTVLALGQGAGLGQEVPFAYIYTSPSLARLIVYSNCSNSSSLFMAKQGTCDTDPHGLTARRQNKHFVTWTRRRLCTVRCLRYLERCWPRVLPRSTSYRTVPTSLAPLALTVQTAERRRYLTTYGLRDLMDCSTVELELQLLLHRYRLPHRLPTMELPGTSSQRHPSHINQRRWQCGGGNRPTQWQAQAAGQTARSMADSMSMAMAHGTLSVSGPRLGTSRCIWWDRYNARAAASLACDAAADADALMIVGGSHLVL